MKRLGSVLHIVNNLLIIRADKTLDTEVFWPNSTVFTKKLKKVGKIKELFGPVKAPYISLSIAKDFAGSELMDLKKERVYLK